MHRIFDIFLILIVILFVLQGMYTPPEKFDVIGPAMWPMTVAVATLLLLIITLFYSPSRPDPLSASTRLVGMIVLSSIFILVQILDIVPFFLIISLFMFCSYMLMLSKVKKSEVIWVLLGFIVFSLVLQIVFTSFIYLDLKVWF